MNAPLRATVLKKIFSERNATFSEILAFAEGLTPKGESMGRSKGSGNPLGLGAKAERNLAIVKAYLAGEKLSALARHYDLTPTRVQKICKRAGADRLRGATGHVKRKVLTPRQRRERAEKRAEYRRLRAEAVDAMRHEGVPWHTVANMLREKQCTVQHEYYTRHKEAVHANGD